MNTGKSEELKLIIYGFLHLDDLVNIVFGMINVKILINNSNTPLEFIDFKSLTNIIKRMILAKNRHVDKRFILDNIDAIKDLSTWGYLAEHKITIDLEIFNRLHKDVKSHLSGWYVSFKLDIPKKILIDYCPSGNLPSMARQSITADEIEYLLSLDIDEEYIDEVYDELAKYQCLTQRHLDIMKKLYPKGAEKVINFYCS
jgi:hypothetical protein